MGGPLPLDPIAEARRLWSDHGWSDAALGMSVVTSVMRAQQILIGRIDEQLRDLDLTFARYEVLMLLTFSRRGSLPMAIIGSRLQVHPTSVTNAVDRLENQGLVQRVPHPTDRRAKLTELTVAGREVALDATERLNRTVFTDTWLEAERSELLVEILRDLRSAAGDF